MSRPEHINPPEVNSLVFFFSYIFEIKILFFSYFMMKLKHLNITPIQEILKFKYIIYICSLVLYYY